MRRRRISPFMELARARALEKICENGKEVKTMETKSRYEVIAELEEKKRMLIMERDGFKEKVNMKKRKIKDLERELEDEKEELKEFESSIEDSKKTISELIAGVEESLQRLGKLAEKS